MAKNKKARTRVNISQGKNARQAENPSSFLSEHPKWQIGRFDSEGPWGTANLDEQTLLEIVFKKLKSYESMTWGEIDSDRKKNHSVEVGALTKNARDRLIVLKLDDLDELFRFRLGGTERVWGIRTEDVFRILWWDPNHEICPSPKRHT